jgi:DNA gyrase subunit A
MLITSGGVLVRTRVDEISVIGRNTQGVKVIRLDAKEKVVGVDKIDGLVDSDELEESDEATLADNESTNTETNNSNEAE